MTMKKQIRIRQIYKNEMGMDMKFREDIKLQRGHEFRKDIKLRWDMKLEKT